MNKKEVQRQETRKRILHVSEDLFRSKGYELTTTRMITTDLGMSRGSLFVHFQTKREILAEILKKEIDKALATGYKKAQKETDLDSKILIIFHHVFKFYFSDVDLTRELLKGVFDRHEVLHAQVMGFYIQLEEMMDKAIKSGEILPKGNKRSISQIIFSRYFMILLNELYFEPKPSLKRAKSELKTALDVIF